MKVNVNIPRDLELVNGSDEKDNVNGKGWTMRRKFPKVGRNETCPCGSGKKYKTCDHADYFAAQEAEKQKEQQQATK